MIEGTCLKPALFRKTDQNNIKEWVVRLTKREFR